MADSIRIAYMGPDWDPIVSRHVVTKGAMGFVRALASVPGIDLFRVVEPSHLKQCDAVIIFHHLATGFYLYENPVYVALVKRIWDRLDLIRVPKFLWHVEPVPTYQQISRTLVDKADVILTSSGLSMFGDKPYIYVPNGVWIEDPPSVSRSKHISAPMNLKYMDALGRTHDDQDPARLHMMRKFAWDLKVDIYGDGWKAHRRRCSPNWKLNYMTSPDVAIRGYQYICEILEDEHFDNLNAIAYASDRIAFALGYGCHLVTNLKWVRSAYKSVLGWEDLANHTYDPVAIRMDAKRYSWECIARSRAPAILEMVRRFKSGRPLRTIPLPVNQWMEADSSANSAACTV